MTIRKSAALIIAAVLAAVLALPDAAPAQNRIGGMSRGSDRMSDGGRGGRGGGFGGGLIGLGVGLATGVMTSQPPAGAQPVDQPTPRRKSSASRNARSGGSGGGVGSAGGGGSGSGAPPAGERRMVPDEVVVELPNSRTPQAVSALARRNRLTQLGSTNVALLGSTFYRWQITDRRSVAAVVRSLEAGGQVASAQPNYLFALQDETSPVIAATPSEGDPAQYAVVKMRLPEAHGIAKGGDIRVAVIDSGIDPEQPELAGTIAGSLDTLKPPFVAHSHGTAIAALIAGHSRLMGSAPEARILGVRAFDPTGGGAEATTFNIIKGLDWAVTQRARIINMSFAGPADPAIHRSLEAAHKKGVVLIAAAGNAGEKSPPLYPAAEPTVIAVTATDSADNLFTGSNRGRHIAVAAPGVDVLIAVPNGGYELSTGTSYSAAEVSGIVALMLQRKGDLTPDAVRGILLATAKNLSKKGRDDNFGAGLADAYRAVTEVSGGQVSDAIPPK
jgi:subtilisin family serine protease